ncbi:hypothetical protein [Bacillus sp. V5-8f]|uniref:hypothetical protein n=1 Tax=Bacillus sp. V5-8f TaxID=2053044 RepID=UPI000C793D81|nr:hypothetical protein [Bacillus sp. V5-8f]PLT35836.1 hypothetical protein CUU64_00750 [Bacillus sp. V5-8f]
MRDEETLKICTCICQLGRDHYGTTISSAHRTTSYKQIDRMEELIGDLIGFIAKTNAKTANGENQLAELEIILARLESQYKYLKKNNDSLLKRMASLEKRMDQRRQKTCIIAGRAQGHPIL